MPLSSPTVEELASAGQCMALAVQPLPSGDITVYDLVQSGGLYRDPEPAAPPLIILFAPLVIFLAPAAPAALISTLDILTWEAVASPAALLILPRPLTYDAVAAPAALVSTLDILTWEAEAAPAALTSELRGGG